MYQGYLDSFYSQNKNLIKGSSYKENLERLLCDSSEYAASYRRTFIKHGLTADCIIANDIILQNKWSKERGKSNNGKELIFKQVKAFEPDILWIEDLRFADVELIEELRRTVKSIRLVTASFCAPFNSLILKKLRSCDFIITCTPGLKQQFEKNGIRSYLVYHGFESDLLERIGYYDIPSGNNVVFSGSLFPAEGYHKTRIDLIERLINEDINLDLYLNLEKRYRIVARNSIYLINCILNRLKAGKLKRFFPLLEYGNSRIPYYSKKLIESSKEPEYGLNMYRLLKTAGIVLNSHGDVAGPFAGNMRLFEATGVGSCLLTDNKSNLSDLFIGGKEIVTYENIDDCIGKIKWLLENEKERKAIAAAGQKKTLECHTVDLRCRTIESIIESELIK